MGMRRAIARVLLAGPLAWWLTVPSAACAQGLVAQETITTPQQLSRSEFSLDKSGELRTPSSDVEDLATEIAAPAPLAEEERAERPVSGPEAETVPATQPLPAEVLALDSNMAARVNDVLACRLEIATDRRVPVSKVAAGSVLLRWTVTPSGAVEGAEVVATRSTDPDVLSCARRKVESWVFVRAPDGQPLHIQQPLRFR
jgi:hypothetical protein